MTSTAEAVALWVQVAAVLAAVGAAIVALVISARDRANAREIAAEDRRQALRQAHLMFELEASTRLTENLNRGGSTDRAEAGRMGSEALTLIGLLGADRLPTQWERRVGEDERLRDLLQSPQTPGFKKDAIEAQLAVNAVLGEIRDALNRP